jgi:hypothetical protein
MPMIFGATLNIFGNKPRRWKGARRLRLSVALPDAAFQADNGTSGVAWAWLALHSLIYVLHQIAQHIEDVVDEPAETPRASPLHALAASQRQRKRS